MDHETEELKAARKRLRDRYGSVLSQKASPEFALLFGTAHEQPPFAASPAEAGGPAAAAPGGPGRLPGAPVVLSCEAPTRKDLRTVLEKGLAGAMLVDDSGAPIGGPPPERIDVKVALKERGRMVTLLQEDFAERLEDVRAGLDERTIGKRQEYAPPGEADGDLGRYQSEVCWLNGTMRSMTDPRALAEIANDNRIEGIGIDAPVVPEIFETVPLVGLDGYGTGFGVDGSGVNVAIIDSEFDTQHASLRARSVQKRNYTSESWGTPGVHGTTIAGIVGSESKTYRGGAPGASLWSYKLWKTHWVPGSAFQSTRAIQEALADGANVANCSWAVRGASTDGTHATVTAVNNAWALGMVIVKSAGNGYQANGSVTCPADATGVIVVGATTRDGTMMGPYTSYGPTLNGLERPHLVAPGGNGQGLVGIHSTRAGGGFADGHFGTSFAAPHVTAAVALLLQADPGLTPDAVRQRLLAACTPVGAGGANIEGAGLLDLRALVPSP